ncbi:MAG: hypothetical protein ACFE9L_05360 [Candidatus Hodarchaeota archaeon]
MIVELNPIPGRGDLTGRPFRGLLNDLNQLYYSTQDRGSSGLRTIKKRIEPTVIVNPTTDIQLNHLVALVEEINVPNYREIKVIS